MKSEDVLAVVILGMTVLGWIVLASWMVAR